MDEQTRERCAATYKQLSSQGYRLLAVAYRSLPEQPAYRLADERDLVLVGYAAFFDPPWKMPLRCWRSCGATTSK